MENSLYSKKYDFEAEITILTEEEGGRKYPAYNGIRWDLRYTDDKKETLYMIWPEFISEDGLLIPKDVPLRGKFRARMYVVVDEMIEKVHKHKMKEGTKFYMVEGPNITATGIVTKVPW